MNVHIYTFYKFHSICRIPRKKILSFNNKLVNLIPIKWQLILINEGSFTQTLYCLTNKNINIKICQKLNHSSIQLNRSIRCIWLENSIYTKLIFARSLWRIKYINIIKDHLNNDTPIGISLIKSQTDTYKYIHEIYYGYSNKIEKKFTKTTLNNNSILWGRKYTLYYKNISYITIQEFFPLSFLRLFY